MEAFQGYKGWWEAFRPSLRWREASDLVGSFLRSYVRAILTVQQGLGCKGSCLNRDLRNLSLEFLVKDQQTFPCPGDASFCSIGYKRQLNFSLVAYIYQTLGKDVKKCSSYIQVFTERSIGPKAKFLRYHSRDELRLN